MELTELKQNLFKIFGVENMESLKTAIYDCCIKNDTDKFQQYMQKIAEPETDNMQKVFQYYSAERKNKKQDFTPKSLAKLIGKLCGDSNTVIDMCSGTGALTIQKWALNNSIKFELQEFDENVIPFLLFNMAVRNIDCTVYHMDVLQQEIYHTYRITPGEQFGIVKEV